MGMTLSRYCAVLGIGLAVLLIASSAVSQTVRGRLIGGTNLPQCNAYSASDGIKDCIDTGETQVSCPDCGGGAMHACPQGYALTGIGYRNNQFRCTLVGPYSSYYISRGENQRFDSHTCADNFFMVALHATSNRLGCASVGRGVVLHFQQGIGQVRVVTECGNTGGNAGIQVMVGYHEGNPSMVCANLRP
jgi:hypothetical protein